MAESYRLGTVPLFRDMLEDQLAALDSAAERRLFRGGEVIFKQGDSPDWLYIMEEGTVDIVLPSAGEEIILASFAPGSFFGELGLFDQQPRNATARAASDAQIICIPALAITRLIDQHPAAARHFLRVVVQRLRGADEMLSRLQIRNPNDAIDEKLTYGERIADTVSRFGGSWTFILLFAGFLIAWMAVNTTWMLTHPPDPFPYIFLNLLLSTVAAIQAPIIMMSQNRQSITDRVRADLDFQVNVKAELAIQQLHRKLDEIRSLVVQ